MTPENPDTLPPKKTNAVGLTACVAFRGIGQSNPFASQRRIWLRTIACQAKNRSGSNALSGNCPASPASFGRTRRMLQVLIQAASSSPVIKSQRHQADGLYRHKDGTRADEQPTFPKSLSSVLLSSFTRFSRQKLMSP